MVKYFIDEDKRTCVCLITIKQTQDSKSYYYQFKGKSKCSPEDTFDKDRGLEIAHVRALIKFKHWEGKSHVRTIDFCNAASDYYQKQSEKFVERLDKTTKALERLENELDDLLSDEENV